MKPPVFGVERFGDSAVVLRSPLRPTRELSADLISLAEQAREIPGVLDAIPGHRTVLIEADPEHVADVASAAASLRPAPRATKPRMHAIVVRYDGEDLGWASEYLSMPVQEIVRLHSAVRYDVRMIGSPGFVYLSAAPATLHMPRRDAPRRDVPAGSVGIGGRQAGIYARAMPGGWRLLGTADDLPEFRPGDRVKFSPA